MRSGRKRRTGAGPPCRCTAEKNSSPPGSETSWETVVGDADVADVPTGPGGADGLHHRLLGADGLYDRVRAEPVGELLDLGDAVVAPGGDDVGGAELPGQSLAGRDHGLQRTPDTMLRLGPAPDRGCRQATGSGSARDQSGPGCRSNERPESLGLRPVQCLLLLAVR